jgi:hypothetical protein
MLRLAIKISRQSSLESHPSASKKKPVKAALAASIAAMACAALMGPSQAWAAPLLGSAQNFSVLAHDTVTNAHNASTPSTQVYGDLGVAPGTSITGFYPDGVVTGGSIQNNNPVAAQALADAGTAYGTLAGLISDHDLTGVVLGSVGHSVLTPGVYHFDTSAQLTGNLVLDFATNQGGSFVFQIGTTLITAAGSEISAINGNSFSSVYWQVGTATTLGANSSFAGNILAAADVSLGSGVQLLCGRAVALGGAVTLIDDTLSNNCSAQSFGSTRDDFGSRGFSGSASPVPEPATALMLAVGLVGIAARKVKAGKA